MKCILYDSIVGSYFNNNSIAMRLLLFNGPPKYLNVIFKRHCPPVPIIILNLYLYVQEVQQNIDKTKQIHINAVCRKITRENKALRYNSSKYIYNIEY